MIAYFIDSISAKKKISKSIQVIAIQMWNIFWETVWF